MSIGGWLVINNSLTLGQLIAAELILSAVIASFVKFGKHLDSFYDLMAATDKLGHLIDLDLERATVKFCLLLLLVRAWNCTMSVMATTRTRKYSIILN